MKRGHPNRGRLSQFKPKTSVVTKPVAPCIRMKNSVSDVEVILAEVARRLRVQGLTVDDLAIRSRLGVEQLHDWLNAPRPTVPSDLRLTTIRSLARGLGIELHALLSVLSG